MKEVWVLLPRRRLVVGKTVLRERLRARAKERECERERERERAAERDREGRGSRAHAQGGVCILEPLMTCSASAVDVTFAVRFYMVCLSWSCV